MATLFDSFLFDTTLFDETVPPPGSFSVTNLTVHNWTATINIGTAPLESDVNSIPR